MPMPRYTAERLGVALSDNDDHRSFGKRNSINSNGQWHYGLSMRSG